MKRALHSAARQALLAYDPPATRLRLVQDGYNATFRVDNRWALRLNVNSPRTDAGLRAELAWVRALSDGTDLRLAAPVRARDGEYIQWFDAVPLNRRLSAVVYEWLPGSDLGNRADAAAFHALGRAMATLHRHARDFPLPAAGLSVAEDVLMFQPNRLPRAAVFSRILHRAGSLWAELPRREPPRILHFDLHPWNAKWYRGRLALFDFDDCCLGWPVQDLAVTTHSLRSVPEGSALEAALRQGYREVSPLPVSDEGEFELHLAARELLEANDRLTGGAGIDPHAMPELLRRSEAALLAYEQTGRFTSTARW